MDPVRNPVTRFGVVAPSLLAAAALATSAPAAAQGNPVNWAMSANPDATQLTIVSGPALFSLGAPAPSVAGSIRKCYGIDQMQGGTQQSGTTRSTAARVVQSFGAASPVPGVQIGLMSVSSASVPSLAGDACFTPFVVQPGLQSQLALVASPGVLTGSAGFPMPTFAAFVFQWLEPVQSPNVLGTDAAGLPLLANVIFEVQGPLNGSADGVQYYLASTAEVIGLDSNRPGGVANGNQRLAGALFGVGAHQSGAVAHTRLAWTQGSTLVASTMTIGAPGKSEIRGELAFSTPQLWARNDGNEGSGGPDWRVGSAPVSTIDLRLLDIVGGAETTPGSSTFDPCLTFNGALFLWSATAASAMLQTPMSWDSSGLPGTPPQPGSIAIGPLATERGGPQTVPLNFDAVTLAFLGAPRLSIGSQLTNVDIIGGVLEGSFSPPTQGISTLAGGPGKLVSAPAPQLVGRQLGIAAVGLQFDGCTDSLILTEFASSLQVSLQ